MRRPDLAGGRDYVAAAVNAGGMGFITALSFPEEPERFRAELRKCRTLTGGKPFGVSFAFSARPNVNDRLLPPPSSGSNLQGLHDLTKARRESGAAIERDVRPRTA